MGQPVTANVLGGSEMSSHATCFDGLARSFEGGLSAERRGDLWVATVAGARA